MSQLKILVPAAALFVAAAVASADPPRPRQPPQEAIDACANAKAGDACTFTLPARDGSGSGHTITGTCGTLPEQTSLACKPDHPPPRGDHDRPPPEGTGG